MNAFAVLTFEPGKQALVQTGMFAGINDVAGLGDIVAVVLGELPVGFLFIKENVETPRQFPFLGCASKADDRTVHVKTRHGLAVAG